jgi:hypothetical protein
MSVSEFIKTNLRSALKTDLMAGYGPYFNKGKKAPSGQSSSSLIISSQQLVARL